MMKKHLTVIALWAVLQPIGAAEREGTARALELSQQWQQGASEPIQTADGRVLFVHGQSQPQLICAVLSVCEIAMEPGERINQVKAGDEVRWILEPAFVGTQENFVQHVTVKPTEGSLRTNLFIATDRRSYNISLLSSNEDSMGMIGFLYGNGPKVPTPGRSGVGQGVPAGYTSDMPIPAPPPRKADVVAVAAPVGHEVLGEELNFGYAITGSNVPWKPVRAYDDGVKTFVDFDKQRVKSRELPALLINDTNRHGAMVNVRYDPKRARYIVDGLFEKASLVLGKGWSRKRVIITNDKRG